MKSKNTNNPYAYFITWTTHGSWLHGDKRGSVSPILNKFGTPRIPHNTNLHSNMKRSLQKNSIFLNEKQRNIVMHSAQATCNHYDWRLFAIHVRTNHVHLIVQGVNKPEIIMTQLKAYATKELNKVSINTLKQNYWSRHGSTRYIWASELLFPVMHYVIDKQGPRMACYYEKWYDEQLSY